MQEQCTGTVAARLLHAPPSLAARGFTRRRKKKKQQGGLDRLLPLFFSSPAVKITVTCKTPKNATSKSVLVCSVLDLFPPVSAPQLWIVIGFLLVAAPSADGRSGGGAEERLGRPREGRRTALLLVFVCRGGGEEAGSAVATGGRRRTAPRRWAMLLLLPPLGGGAGDGVAVMRRRCCWAGGVCCWRLFGG